MLPAKTDPKTVAIDNLYCNDFEGFLCILDVFEHFRNLSICGRFALESPVQQQSFVLHPTPTLIRGTAPPPFDRTTRPRARTALLPPAPALAERTRAMVAGLSRITPILYFGLSILKRCCINYKFVCDPIGGNS